MPPSASSCRSPPVRAADGRRAGAARPSSRPAGPGEGARRPCRWPRAAARGRRAALLRPGAALVPRPVGAGQRRSTTSRPPCACAGRLDAAALAAALGEIVRRHEALRTTFAPRGGRAVQVIAAPARRSLCRVVDLAGLAAAARETELARLAAEEARRPFDLAARAAGARRPAAPGAGGARRSSGPCTTSSPTAGRWAFFLRELAALYGAFAAGLPSPLPPLPIQYADFARLAAAVARGRSARAAARLLARPARAARRRPRSARPTAPARPSQSCARRRRRRCSRPALTAELDALARREGATPVHGPARRLPGAARPLHRPGGPGRRLADRQPQPAGDRGADRLLRQHPRAACRPLRRPELPRAAVAAFRTRLSAPTPTRTCRSKDWWWSCRRRATWASRRCSR